MKLSDYVISFMEQRGVKNVFMVPGDGVTHLVDSLGKNKNINYISFLHEISASIATEGYSQYTGEVGITLVSDGGGVNSAITGLTAAWADSTPVLFISGKNNDDKVREADIISMVSTVTKMAENVDEPLKIKYYLEKAYHTMISGRKGPVWLNIPSKVQSYDIGNPDKLEGFISESRNEDTNINKLFSLKINELVNLISNSKRPVFLIGNGLRLSTGKKINNDYNARERFFNQFGSNNDEIDVVLKLIEKINTPVLSTWKTFDIFDYNNPLYFGSPGVLGNRGANFILQNCDLLVVIGSSLDKSLTADNWAFFAKNAKKVVIDIDEQEINKLNPSPDFKFTADAGDVVRALYVSDIKPCINEDWINFCKKTYKKYNCILPEYNNTKRYVNSYHFIDLLSDMLYADDIIVTESTGSACNITYQAFRLKSGQKMQTALGLGSMGFGLPYAIGACVANKRRRTILLNGDGGLQPNIQEFQTIIQNNLPIKMFIWNNGGYAGIMNLQRNYFNGNYVACNNESGLSMPNIKRVAEAYNIKAFTVYDHENLKDVMNEVLEKDGPALCELMMSPFMTACPCVLPQENSSIENMFPFLEESEIRANILKWE